MMEYIDKCIQFGTEDLGIKYEQFDNELYKKAKELVARLGMEIRAPKRVKKNEKSLNPYYVEPTMFWQSLRAAQGNIVSLSILSQLIMLK